MPNSADQDRLTSKTSNGTIVDLAAYRAQANAPAKTGAPYLSAQTLNVALLIFGALAFFAMFVRR